MSTPEPANAATESAAATAVEPSELFERGMDALEELRSQVPQVGRITTVEVGLMMAMAAALRADCTRRRVGAVVADVHGRVIGTGRNGAPPGRPGCLTAGACPRGRLGYDQVAPGSSYSAGSGACIALHAEVNAVLYSASPQARLGGTMYVTDAPCDDCFKVLAGSGLARVYWPVQPENIVDSQWGVEWRDLTQGPVGGLYG